MSSFVRDMQKRNKEQERIEKTERVNKEITKKIHEFANSLEMMFMVDESENSIKVTKDGEFTVHKKHEIDMPPHLSTWYGFFDPVPKEVMTLKRFGKQKASLVLAFHLSESVKEYLRTKYAIHLQSFKGLQVIKFTALDKSVFSNDLQEIVVQLLEDFAENGSKFNSLDTSMHKMGGGIGVGLKSLRSYYNPCAEIFSAPLTRPQTQPSLQTKAFMAGRQSGRTSYAFQQMTKLVDEAQKDTTIYMDTEASLSSIARNFKNVYYTRERDLLKPDIDIDVSDRLSRYRLGSKLVLNDYTGQGLPKGVITTLP